MTIKDLKIGDWVMVDGSPYQIEELSPDGNTLIYDDEDNKIKSYNIEDFKPIYITEEILNKNKFFSDLENTELRHRWDENIYIMDYWHDTNRWAVVMHVSGLSSHRGNIVIKWINYVHELQHVLWVMGFDDNLIIE